MSFGGEEMSTPSEYCLKVRCGGSSFNRLATTNRDGRTFYKWLCPSCKREFFTAENPGSCSTCRGPTDWKKLDAHLWTCKESAEKKKILCIHEHVDRASVQTHKPAKELTEREAFHWTDTETGTPFSFDNDSNSSYFDSLTGNASEYVSRRSPANRMAYLLSNAHAKGDSNPKGENVHPSDLRLNTAMAMLVREISPRQRNYLSIIMEELQFQTTKEYKKNRGNYTQYMAPVTTAEQRDILLENKYSVCKSIPVPIVHALVDGHAYVPPRGILQYAFGNGVVFEAIDSRALVNSGARMSVPQTVSARKIYEGAVGVRRDGNPLVLWYVIWSDDMDPTSSLSTSNRGSIWVCSITISCPYTKRSQSDNTFLVGLGPKKSNHFSLLRRLGEDLKALGDGSQRQSFVHSGTQKKHEVYLDCFAVIMDTPERRGVCGISSFHSSYTPRWGYTSNLIGKIETGDRTKVLDNLRSCDKCYDNRRRGQWNGNATCSDCSDWNMDSVTIVPSALPKEYPRGEIDLDEWILPQKVDNHLQMIDDYGSHSMRSQTVAEFTGYKPRSNKRSLSIGDDTDNSQRNSATRPRLEYNRLEQNEIEWEMDNVEETGHDSHATGRVIGNDTDSEFSDDSVEGDSLNWDDGDASGQGDLASTPPGESMATGPGSIPTATSTSSELNNLLRPKVLNFEKLRVCSDIAFTKYFKKDWTKKEAETFLAFHGLSLSAAKSIIDFSDHCSDKGDQAPPFEACRYYLDREISPSIWNFNESVRIEKLCDTIMHQLFLGVAKSTAALFHKWLKLEGRYTSFKEAIKAVSQGWPTIEYCKPRPYGTGEWGGWISENMIYLSRVMPWLYEPGYWLKQKDADFVCPDDTPIQQWTVAQLKGWLKNHGVRGLSKLRKEGLLTKVADTIEIIKQRQEANGALDLGGLVARMIRSFQRLLAIVMQKQWNDGLTIRLDNAIKIYLTEVHKVDSALARGKSKKDWKPVVVAKTNLISLLNLPKTRESMGPCSLVYEGNPIGEKILREVKGIFHGRQQGFELCMMHQFYQNRSLRMMFGGIEDRKQSGPDGGKSNVDNIVATSGILKNLKRYKGTGEIRDIISSGGVLCGFLNGDDVPYLLVGDPRNSKFGLCRVGFKYSFRSVTQCYFFEITQVEEHDDPKDELLSISNDTETNEYFMAIPRINDTVGDQNSASDNADADGPDDVLDNTTKTQYYVFTSLYRELTTLSQDSNTENIVAISFQMYN